MDIAMSKVVCRLYAGCLCSMQPVLSFMFHEKCGQNIRLIDQQRTAERTACVEHGIVLSAELMQVDMLYEVSVVCILRL